MSGRTLTVGEGGMTGWRPGLPYDAEPTQTRDLSPLVLATFAEVYVNALRIRDDVKDLAELFQRAVRDLERVVVPQGLDEHPVWHYSGMSAAHDALETILVVIFDTLGLDCPPAGTADDPRWPTTAAPLPDLSFLDRRSCPECGA